MNGPAPELDGSNQRNKTTEIYFTGNSAPDGHYGDTHPRVPYQSFDRFECPDESTNLKVSSILSQEQGEIENETSFSVSLFLSSPFGRWTSTRGL